MTGRFPPPVAGRKGHVRATGGATCPEARSPAAPVGPAAAAPPEQSFSDAVRNAVKTAAQTLRKIRGVDVISSQADVGENGELTLYKVNCKIAFLIEQGGSAGG